MQIYEKSFRKLYAIEEKKIDDTTFYAKVKLSPYQRGQGITVANTLRRILLSELDCIGIHSVQIEGVSHEFTVKAGIRESIPEILSNLSTIVFRCVPCTSTQKQSTHKQGDVRNQHYEKQYDMHIDNYKILTQCNKSNAGSLYAKDINLPTDIQCVAPKQPIATLVSAHTDLRLNLLLLRSKGYTQNSPHNNMQLLDIRSASSAQTQLKDAPFLPIDTSFNPVKKINYSIHQEWYTTTAQESIFLEIWTDGSSYPVESLAKASLILRQLFQPFTL
jgi:DNA-directed RNA polymerase subunit alpha